MKRILRVVGIVFAILVLGLVALPFLIDANQFRPRLESELSHALGRDVKVGDLKLAIFSGGVTAADLSVADDPAYSRTPFLYTRSLTLGVEMWPLVTSHALHVTELTIDQPQINLLQSAAGDWNFSSLGGKRAPKTQASEPAGTPLDLSVKLVKITNGHLSFAQHDANAKARELGSVNVEVHDFAANAAFPFSFSGKLAGGGDIHLEGSAGPVNSADAAQTPAKVKVKLTGFDLEAAGLDTSAGLGGLVSIEGIAAANGKSLFVNGKLKVDKLKLAKNGSPAKETVEFDFEVNHDMRKNSGVLRRGQIHVGSAPASLTGTYATAGRAPSIEMSFSGPEMAVPQLAGMLPAFGVVLPAGSSLQGGTANAHLTFAGPVDALVINGTLGMNNTRLTGFDLGSKMATVQKLAGIKTGPNTEIQTLGATLHMAPDGSTLQDIKLVAPAIGDLSGAGTISPSQALNFKMRANLHTGGMALSMLGVKGDTGVPFVVEGTASNPVFRADVGAMASEQVQRVEKNMLGKSAGGLLDSVLKRKK